MKRGRRGLLRLTLMLGGVLCAAQMQAQTFSISTTNESRVYEGITNDFDTPQDDRILTYAVVGAGTAPSGNVTITCTVTATASTSDVDAMPGDFSSAVSSGTQQSAYPTDTLTFTASNHTTAQNCEFYIHNDSDYEPDESFTVTITAAGGGASVDNSADSVTGIIGINDYQVGFQQSRLTAGENSFIQACVAVLNPGFLTSMVGLDSSFSITTRNGTATGGEDYDQVTNQIMGPFNNTRRSECAVIETSDDSLNEARETFFVDLADRPGSQLSFGVVNITPSSATVAINDGDPITASLSAPLQAIEGSRVTVTFSLSGGTPTAAVTLPWSISGTDITVNDFVGLTTLSGEHSIATTNPDYTLTLAIANEGAEPDDVPENFTIAIGSGASSAGAVNPHATDGSDDVQIVAADTILAGAPRFAITAGPTSIPEGASNAASTAFTITVQNAALLAATDVRWTVAPDRSGGQRAPEAPDFYCGGQGCTSLPSGTVNFGASDFTVGSTKTFTLPIRADSLAEPDEHFVIRLSGASGTDNITYGADYASMIAANDPITLTIARASTTMASVGEAATASFTFTLAGGDRGFSINVPFTVSGLDNSEFAITTPSGLGADAVQGQVRFSTNNNQKVQTVTINLQGDMLNEASKTLTVTGGTPGTPNGAPVNYTTGGNMASVTVTDDDGISVSIAVAGTDADTNTAGHQVEELTQATFTVTLSNASAAAVSVPYTIGGDAAITSADYTDVTAATDPNTTSNGTLVIPANSSSGVIYLNILDNTDTDDDASEDLTVTLTADDSATMGTDEGPTTGTGGGTAARTSSASGQSATAKLVKSSAARTLTLARTSSAAFAETNASSNIGFTVSLGMGDTAFASPTQVTWNITHVSTEDADFSATTGTIMFPTQSTFNVAVVGDSLNEITETFNIAVSVANAGADGGTNYGPAVVVAIADDDPVAYSITGPGTVAERDLIPFSGAENDAPMIFTVNLSNASEGDITVPFSIDSASTASRTTRSDGTSDYTGGPAMPFVTISAGDTSAEIEFSIRANRINQPDRTLILNIEDENDDGFAKGAAAGVVARSSNAAEQSATGTIGDDDAIVVTLRAPSQAVEGSTISINFSLSGGTPSADVVLPWTITGSGIGADDFTGLAMLSGTHTIATANPSYTLALVIANEGGADPDDAPQTFTFETPSASASSAGAVQFTSDNDSVDVQIVAAGTIVTGAPRFAISAGPASIGEGSADALSADFTITLSNGALAAATDVAWAVVHGATTADDFSIASGVVTFSADDLSVGSTKAFKLGIAEDSLSEATESFVIRLSGASGSDNISYAADYSSEITDHSADALRVGIVFAPVPVEEGRTVELALSLIGGAPTADIELTFDVSGGSGAEITAADLADYNAISGLAFTVPQADTSPSLNIALARDGVADEPERMIVTLRSASSAGDTALAPSITANVDILALATYDFALSGPSEVDEGGGNVEYTVTHSGARIPAVAGMVTLDWTVAAAAADNPGGASAAGAADFGSGADSDFPSGDNAISFSNSDAIGATKTFSVALNDDSSAEGPEFYSVSIGDVRVGGEPDIAYNVAAGAGKVVATIGAGDNALAITCAAHPGAATAFQEGANAGNVFNCRHSAAAALYNDVSIAWHIYAGGGITTVSNSHTAATDFAANSGALLLPAGTPPATDVVLSVMPNDDAMAEAAETFSVVLGAVTQGAAYDAVSSIGGTAATDISIAASTAAVVRNFAIALDSATTDRDAMAGGVQVNEGDALSFGVSLSGTAPAAGNDAVVTWAVGGDLEDSDHDGAGGTLRFTSANYMTAQTISFDATDDALNEAAETLTVTLSAASGGGGGTAGITSGSESASVTILPSDPVTYSTADVAANEGAMLTVSITLSGESEGDVTVPFVIGNASTAGSSDYTAPAAPLSATISAGELSADIDIATSADSLNEANETILVLLAAETDSAFAKGAAAGVVTRTASASGQGATATITDDDPITIAIGNLPGSSSLQATVPDIGLTDNAGTVEEGETARFPLTISGGTATADVVVTYALGTRGLLGANINLGDFSGVSSLSGLMLTIPRADVGGGSLTLDVGIAQDNVADEGELLVVTLTAASSAGVVNLATGDPDAIGGGVIVAAEYSTFALRGPANVDESAGTAEYTVTYTGEDGGAIPAGGATLDWGVTANAADNPGGLNAASAADFSGYTPGLYPAGDDAVSFPAGAPSGATATFAIALNDDSASESAEFFSVTLSDVKVNGAANTEFIIAGGGGGKVVTTLNRSEQALSISCAVHADAATALTEGTAGNVMSCQHTGDTLNGDVQIAWRIYDNHDVTPATAASATAATDFMPGSGMLVIPSGTATGTAVALSVTPADDEITEDAENFSVVLGAVGVPVDYAAVTSIGGVANANISIAANDPKLRTFGIAVNTASGKTTDRDTTAPGVQVNEGDTVYFNVSLTGTAPTVAASVTWLVSGVESSDVSGVPAAQSNRVLTFTTTNHATAQEVSFTVAQETLNEAAETLTVGLESPIGGGGTGSGLTSGSSSASVVITANDAVTYSIADAADVAEGADGADTAMTFTVSLSAASEGGVTLPFTITSASTASGGGADYDDLPALSVTIAAGSTSQDISININGDGLNEADETIVIEIAAETDPAFAKDAAAGAVTRTTTAADQRATGAIPDDDDITVGIGDVAQVEEGETLSFPLTISGGALSADLLLTFDISGDVDAADLSDYSALTGQTFTLAAAANPPTLDIAIERDAVDDEPEDLTITLTALSSAGMATINTGMGANADASVSIVAASIIGTFALSGPSAVDETPGTAEYTVTYTGSAAIPGGGITLDWTVATATADNPGGATAASAADFGDGTAGDLPSGDDAIVFPATAASGATQTFSIALNDDSAAEEAEFYTAAIGDLKLNGAASSDYEVAAMAGKVTTTIGRNDHPLALACSAHADAASGLAEGAAANVMACRHTTAGLTLAGDVAIAWHVYVGSGITTVSDSHTAASSEFESASGTLILPQGTAANSDVILTLTATADNVDEVDERFSVVIGAVTPPADYVAQSITAAADITVTGNIVNVVRNFAIAVAAATSDRDSVTGGVQVNEGDALRFSVSLTGEAPASGNDAMVVWAVGGGDLEASDHNGAGGTLSFTSANWQTPQTLSFSALADALNEAAETLTVTISAPSGGGGSGATGIAAGGESASVVIQPSDAIAAAIAAPSPATVDEGQMVRFAVSLSGASNGSAADITVNYTASGATVSDANSGSIVIAAGELSGEIVLRIPSNTDRGDGETDTLRVEIGSVSAGSGGGLAMPAAAPGNSAAVTVNHLSAAHTFAFSNPAARIDEGAGAATFTVARIGPPIGASIVLRWTYAAGASNPAAPADFPGGAVPAGGELTFTGSDASQTFTISTGEDSLNEAGETFTLGLSATPSVLASEGGVALGNPVTVTIADDDPIIATLSGGGSVAEGGSAAVTVTLSGGTPTADVAVAYSIGGTAPDTDVEATAADYDGSAASGSFDIATGAASGAAAIPITDDNLNEPPETFSVSISASSTGAVTIAGAPQLYTISDDDAITASIAAASSAVEEGGSVDFTITLAGASSGSAGQIQVAYGLTIGGSAPGARIADSGSGSVTIAAGALSAAFSVSVLSDTTRNMGSEPLVAAISAVNPGSGAGSASTAAPPGASASVTINYVAALRSISVTGPATAVDEDSVSAAGQTAMATFTITMSGTVVPETPVVVPWSITSPDNSLTLPEASGLGRSFAATDLGPGAAQRGMVTFPAGSSVNPPTEIPVNVPIAQDALNEGVERLQLALGMVPPGAGCAAATTRACTLVSGAPAEASVAASDPITIFLAPSEDSGTLVAGENASYVMSFGTTTVNGQVVPVVTTSELIVPLTVMVGGTMVSVPNVRVPSGAQAVPVTILSSSIAANTQTGTPMLTVVVEAPSGAPSGATARPGTQADLDAQPEGRTKPAVATPAPQQVAGWELTVTPGGPQAFEGAAYQVVFALDGDALLIRDGVNVPWSTAPRSAQNGAAAEAADFGPGTGTPLSYDCRPNAAGACTEFPRGVVEFTNGVASITLSIALRDNDDAGGRESIEGFTFALDTLSGGDSARTRFADDSPLGNMGAQNVDIPALRAELGVADVTAPEGGNAVFTLTLSAFGGGQQTTRDVVVEYALGAPDDTAVRGVDYTAAAAGTITIPAGEAAAQLSIPLLPDGILESRETFTLFLTSISGGGGAVRFANPDSAGRISATGTITDDVDQARQQNRRVSTLLAVLDRSSALLAAGAVSERISRAEASGRGGAGASMSIAGRELIAGAGNAGAAADGAAPAPQAAPGLGLALFGATGAAGAETGASGAAASGAAAGAPGGSAGSAAFGGLGAGLAGDLNMGRRTALPSLAQLAGHSSFNVNAAGWDWDNGLTLWGSGGVALLEGDPVLGGSRFQYDGSSTAFFFGAENSPREDLLTGVALGFSLGDVDFTDHSPQGAPLTGKIESEMLSVRPYASLWLSPDLKVWLSVGYGIGSLHLEERVSEGGATSVRTAETDSESLAWSAGLGGRLPVLDDLTELWLRLQVTHASSEADAAIFSDGLPLAASKARSTRVSGEAELGRNFALPGGLALRPFATAQLRMDLGAAVSQDVASDRDAAMDLGGGAELLWPGQGVSVQLAGRVQLNDTGHQEHRVGVDVNYDLGADNQGLTLALQSAVSERIERTTPTPGQGAVAGGARPSGFAAAAATAGLGAGAMQQSLSGEVAYGVAFRQFGRSGLLTPYGRFDLSRKDQRWAAGLRLAETRGGLEIGLEAGLDFQSTGAANAASAAPRSYDLLLSGRLRF